ncbi:hypothetical protein BOTBODRAFT_190414 [Botryobasidium botryosum FD-172 SS1]|uniref:DNA 3'-5' helicase n=1 Tax=Botryobasidium botryosum (strain FD-172 SS1) TaxID=930990 RepID=A0A067M4V9_BOTB1|nr:hypothetical protein BOTBODRAFT_190414 [Botryobasidium botryosum FD-172 SS1]
MNTIVTLAALLVFAQAAFAVVVPHGVSTELRDALNHASATCVTALQILRRPFGSAASNPLPFSSLRNDLLSLLQLIYSHATRLSLALKPPRTPAAAIKVLADLDADLSRFVACASCIGEKDSGATILKEVSWCAQEVVEEVQGLVECFGEGIIDDEDKTYLMKTGALHASIERFKQDLSVDNRGAVVKRWKSNDASLQDALVECKDMTNADEDMEDDGWDEIMGEGEKKEKMSEEEVERANKVYTLLRLTGLLHRRVQKDFIPLPALTSGDLDSLLDISTHLASLADDLVSSLYPPQDVDEVNGHLKAVESSVQQLQQAIKSGEGKVSVDHLADALGQATLGEELAAQCGLDEYEYSHDSATPYSHTQTSAAFHSDDIMEFSSPSPAGVCQQVGTSATYNKEDIIDYDEPEPYSDQGGGPYYGAEGENVYARGWQDEAGIVNDGQSSLGLYAADPRHLQQNNYVSPQRDNALPAPSNALSEFVQPTPIARGENPRNTHGVRLRPVSELPDAYRGIFKFGVFNAVQSQCLDKILRTDENIILSAPTGSGKTVAFELALIRLLLNNGSDPASGAKCVYMAPTKALCSERFRDWTEKFRHIGIKCCELTGDTFQGGKSAWAEAKDSTVIITTPEKWDSLTRNWGDNRVILSRMQLFLVDEIHILNATRGSTLEVCISRMKTRGTSVRFVLVSATVPNIEDIAAWIGNPGGGEATVFKFGEEYRPCKLVRHVYAYPRKQQNEWQFTRNLDFKLFSILQEHAQNMPVLVFCATRKNVSVAADILAKEYTKAVEAKKTPPWSPPTRIENVFQDKQLQTLAASGIGIHHAGLSIDDRKATEGLFLKKVLRVVVATSTLANLSIIVAAHTVVIKGVKMWQNNTWEEYSDLDILQMLGRAGRPQFDKEGVAVIMCESEFEKKYRQLVSGTMILESCLHLNLTEHINSEIGLGTITDVESAKDWLHNSFLFRRLQKNPKHYALGKALNQSWQERLDDIVAQSISSLHESNLVQKLDNDLLKATEYGEIMSRYYINFATMEYILKIPGNASVKDILEMLSNASEFNDLRLRATEKQIYNKLREHMDIRYSIPKVEKVQHKIFVLIQAVLGGMWDGSPKSMLPSSANTDLSVRSLTAKAWEDRPVVLRQIEQIGEKSIKVLAGHGVTSLTELRKQEAPRLELLLNRRHPFGTEILKAVQALPSYSISITEERVTSSGGRTPVRVTLNIQAGLDAALAAHKSKKQKGPSLGMTSILVLTSDLCFLDFRRIPTKALQAAKSFSITAELSKPSQAVHAYISPENFAGLTVSATYKPNVKPSEYPTPDTRPPNALDLEFEELEEVDPSFWEISDDEFAAIMQKPAHESQDTKKPKNPETSGTQKLPSEISKMANGNYRCEWPKFATKSSPSRAMCSCNHACKDKQKCRHLCCREGLPKPPPKKRPTQSNTTFDPLTDDEPISRSPSKHKTAKAGAPPTHSPDKQFRALEKLHRSANVALSLPAGGRLLNRKDANTQSVHPTREQLADILPTWVNLDGEDADGEDLPDPNELVSSFARSRQPEDRRDRSTDDSTHYTDSEMDTLIAQMPSPNSKDRRLTKTGHAAVCKNPISHMDKLGASHAKRRHAESQTSTPERPDDVQTKSKRARFTLSTRGTTSLSLSSSAVKEKTHLESTARRTTTGSNKMSPLPVKEHARDKTLRRTKPPPLFLSASESSAGEEECAEPIRDGQGETSDFDFELDKSTFDLDSGNVQAYPQDAALTPAVPTSDIGGEAEGAADGEDVAEKPDWLDDELADFEEWLRSGSVNVVE